MDREIIYIGDPMCSWCWGFSPTLQAIHAEFGDLAPLRVIVGGLRPGETAPMSDDMKATIRHHWESVHEATGQPFCFDILDGEGFVMDTEPCCRAVVTMRGLRPAATLPYFAQLHHAFYADNQLLNNADTLATLAAPFGISTAEFTTAFDSDKIKQATAQDFQLTQRLGVRGFPSVILRHGQDLSLLTSGYQPFAALRPIISHWCKTMPDQQPTESPTQEP